MKNKNTMIHEKHFNTQKSTQWAKEYLVNNGYNLQGSLEPVRLMPWSHVHRILTLHGYIYLKQMSPPFSIEAKFLNYCSEQFHASLPHMIASNEDLGCFLMKDAGVPLRDIMKNEYRIDLICKALDSYATLQRGAINHIDNLLSLGVPDWRLAELPQLYQNLVNKTEFLEIDGLKKFEIDKLQNLYPKFKNLCELLSHYKIPATIEHCDFQDNNILLKDQCLTISDWGDTIISHPFFSLLSFLKSAARNHNITENSDKYCELRDTYLNKWLEVESKDRLLEAFELAKRIEYAKFAISYYRIMLCSGIDEFEPYKGRITEALQTFIQSESQKCPKPT